MRYLNDLYSIRDIMKNYRYNYSEEDKDEEIYELKETIKSKDKKIKKLNETIEEYKDILESLHEYQKTLDFKNKEIARLNGIIQDYRKRMSCLDEEIYKQKTKNIKLTSETQSKNNNSHNLNSFVTILRDESLNKNDVSKYVNDCIKLIRGKISILNIPSSLRSYIDENRLQGCNEDRYIKLFDKINKQCNVDIEYQLLRYKAKLDNTFINDLRIYIINNYVDIRDVLNLFSNELNEIKNTLNLLFHPDKVKDENIKEKCIEIFRTLQDIFN